MSEPNTLLRLDVLSVENFRCFASCNLGLHPELTILVAENGQGKTALLDAAGLALDTFVSAMVDGRVSTGFSRGDIRQSMRADKTPQHHLPTSFHAEGLCNSIEVTWHRTANRVSARQRTSSKQARPLQDLALALCHNSATAKDARTVPALLPAVAYYRTDRFQLEAPRRRLRSWAVRQDLGRRVAYVDCLSLSASFHSFLKWFEKRWLLLKSSVSRYEPEEERSQDQLAAVRSAVATVLEPTGWTDLTWEPSNNGPNQGLIQPGFLAAVHPEYGQLPLPSLSDGVRNMLALVADLAHRCARLNPHLGEDAARRTPGILLIDEVDMHLHPGWQQQIVALIRQAFPCMQMVFTTHSPHVLSTVDADSIRVIYLDGGQGDPRKPTAQTRGDESGNVLSRTMHVNPVPDVGPARLLSEYRGLLQNGLDRSERAQAVWRELISHFGECHHLLLEAAVLRDLQEFKRQYNNPAAGGPH